MVGTNGGGPTEIVSLTDGATIPDCLNELTNGPGGYQGAGGALPDSGKT